ncbi:MAG TPA: DUF2630 family protein [Ktedonobacteraceae bacterium]|nr:DUF2630 family protein [Ktedonobacteraceae bacterium]
MEDTTILHNIDSLVKEEHTLMTQAESGELTDEQHARLKEIEVSLDNVGTCCDNAGQDANLA